MHDERAPIVAGRERTAAARLKARPGAAACTSSLWHALVVPAAESGDVGGTSQAYQACCMRARRARMSHLARRSDQMTFKGGSSLVGGGELVAAINASSAPSRRDYAAISGGLDSGRRPKAKGEEFLHGVDP